MKTMVTFSMMILLSTITSIAQIPNNGLTHAYFMNGDGKDASGNGYDLLERYPNDTTDHNGVDGKAMSFKRFSHSCFRLEDSTLPSGNSPFTILLWARNDIQRGTLISWGTNEPSSYISIYVLNTSTGFNIGITNGIDSIDHRLPAEYREVNVWAPIAVSYDGNLCTIFCSDSIIINESITINTVTNNYMGIGARFLNNSAMREFFEGAIDLTLIYNRKLSQTEITNIFNSEEIINQTPIITSSPVITGTIGEIYQYALTGSDPNGDDMTYRLISEINEMFITNNTINWTPTDTGTYNIVVSVTDGIASSTQEYSITVTEPIFVNTPPVFITTAKTQAKVGNEYNYKMKAYDTDTNEQTLTYLIIEGPTSMTINDNTTSWFPTIDGSYDIKVAVTDDIDTVYQEYTITVEPTTSVRKAMPPAQYQIKAKNIVQYTINGRKLRGNVNINRMIIKNGRKILNIR